MAAGRINIFARDGLRISQQNSWVEGDVISVPRISNPMTRAPDSDYIYYYYSDPIQFKRDNYYSPDGSWYTGEEAKYRKTLQKLKEAYGDR